MELLSPVLRPVDKTKNVANPAAAATSAKTPGKQLCEQTPLQRRVIAIREDIERLFTGCLPPIDEAIHRWLTEAQGADRALLDAWTTLGARDCRRGQEVRISNTAKNTLTPLGLACLVCYSRGYLDELEAQEAAEAKQQAVGSYRSPQPSPPENGDGAPTAPRPRPRPQSPRRKRHSKEAATPVRRRGEEGRRRSRRSPG